MLRVNAMITGLALGEEVATQFFSEYKARAKFFILQN
jgi:hypothetical protein